MLARCPNCRATFSTDRTGQQNCPACGKPLFVPEAPPVLATSGPSDPAAPGPRFGEAPGNAVEPPPAGTPWERRPELPALRAWFETVKLALFEPSKLFSLARLDKRREQATFAVATYAVFSALGMVLSRLFEGQQQERMLNQIKESYGAKIPPWLMTMLMKNVHPSAAVMIFSILCTPLFGLLFLYLNALVTHFFAMIFGQNRKGFPATFAACAYAMAPLVLLAIPACGSLAAIVWLVVLIGIGLKRTHGISVGGATATTLGPYIILCCAGCAMLMLMVTVGASALSGGGATGLGN